MMKTWVELGDQGHSVRAWQAIVGATVDGTFGPSTLHSVRSWQASRNIEPDGIIGASSRAALEPGDLARGCEGLVLYTYDDGEAKWPHTALKLNESGQYVYPNGAPLKGYPTIGRGRLLVPGERILTCTREEADSWFDSSVKARYLPNVVKYAPPDPAQQCAVVSFSVNLGEGDVPKLAAAGFSPEFWASFNRTKGIPNVGLKLRRLAEIALFYGPAFQLPEPENVA